MTKGCIRKSGTPDCTSQQSCSGHGTCEGEADQKGTCQCDEGFENDEELGCRTPPTPPPVTFAPNANTTDGRNFLLWNLFMIFYFASVVCWIFDILNFFFFSGDVIFKEPLFVTPQKPVVVSPGQRVKNHCFLPLHWFFKNRF